jgi:hypothetical protein
MNSALSGTRVQWRKSSYSTDTANCVEFALLSAVRIGVRDSKDSNGPMISYDSVAWRDFVAAVRAGAFGR